MPFDEYEYGESLRSPMLLVLCERLLLLQGRQSRVSSTLTVIMSGDECGAIELTTNCIDYLHKRLGLKGCLHTMLRLRPCKLDCLMRAPLPAKLGS